MGIAQLILLAGIVIFGVYATRLRSRLSDRLAYLVLALAGIVLVLRPEWSNQLAHRVGIGRGADLVFYLFIVFSLFFFVSSAANRRRIERDLTLVVRALALQTPTVVDSLAKPSHGEDPGLARAPGAQKLPSDDSSSVTPASRKQP
jgi:hypothetical protein